MNQRDLLPSTPRAWLLVGGVVAVLVVLLLSARSWGQALDPPASTDGVEWLVYALAALLPAVGAGGWFGRGRMAKPERDGTGGPTAVEFNDAKHATAANEGRIERVEAAFAKVEARLERLEARSVEAQVVGESTLAELRLMNSYLTEHRRQEPT